MECLYCNYCCERLDSWKEIDDSLLLCSQCDRERINNQWNAALLAAIQAISKSVQDSRDFPLIKAADVYRVINALAKPEGAAVGARHSLESACTITYVHQWQSVQNDDVDF